MSASKDNMLWKKALVRAKGSSSLSPVGAVSSLFVPNLSGIIPSISNL